MLDSMKQGNADNVKLRNILLQVHPDTVKSVSPELYNEATELAAMLTQAKDILVKHGSEKWVKGTYEDSEKVHFIRLVENKYAVAERETLIGNPRELMENLSAFIKTGELPSGIWEAEVTTRTNTQTESDKASGMGPEFEAVRAEQEKLREQCKPIKEKLEREFSFTVDLGDISLDGKKILQELKWTEEEIAKMSPESRENIIGTSMSFVDDPGNFLKGMYPFGNTVQLNMDIPGYFRQIHLGGEISFAGNELGKIRAKYADKVISPESLPTEKAFFWLQDAVATYQSEYGITLNFGKYDDNSNSKILDVYYLTKSLVSLSDRGKKYIERVRGITISWDDKLARKDGYIIKYPWPGTSDSSAGDLERRIRNAVDNPRFFG